ncbi:hypothetical protein [Shewanella sp. NIFS-20-20]|uniref:hypothetical protein n=1 Tax=Shewanella sp. NIFS-20-20 TaxID=2853806 RepID=UPI001C47069C|nr:hypothetical protein [Shewanella sp. NIFS-20-20]MBV7316671.1 hypothetical protein [Shewanella sp. NIFS-20-20]
MVSFSAANLGGSRPFKASPLKLVIALMLMVASFAFTLVALPLLLLLGVIGAVGINMAWRRLQKRQRQAYQTQEPSQTQTFSTDNTPFDDRFRPHQHQAQTLDLPSTDWQRKD